MEKVIISLKNASVICGMILLSVLFFGCATTQSTQGSQLKEESICNIAKGKTTRSEILKTFGAPDRIIEAGLTGESKTAIGGDVNLSAQQNISIGRNQEIYVYEYTEEITERNLVNLYYGGGKTTKKKNTLMIWIDKDTGIVQDYGYKKEI